MPTSDPKAEISVDATPTGSSPVPEPEYHLTFVDSALPPVSLFRQILERFREPKITVPKKHYQEKVTVDATPTESAPIPGPEYHATLVDSPLPPVSLFRQILERLRERKITIPKEYYRGRVSLPAAEMRPQILDDPNQLRLPFEKAKTLSMPITSQPIDVRGTWPDYQLLVELEPEAARWRRRTMFLVSVVLHAGLVLLILFAPDLLRRGRRMVGIPAEAAPRRELSFLWLPPDVLRRLQEPPPDASALSNKNRRAQGPSPLIDPNGLHMPYSRGNTPLPEIAGGAPAAAPTPPPGGAAAPGTPGPQPSAPAPGAPKTDGGLRFEEARPETGGGGSGLRLPSSTPGEAIRQSLQAAARGRGRGGTYGSGDSNLEFENVHPNFSTQGPIILSDTLGVDFGPYLARIVYIVRRNWYAVIPESARLGEKGRVSVVFEILKDGSVPQLRLVASSGADPLDRAAVAGIQASIPFPPLPEEFTGNHLVLQFIFLYNLEYVP